MKYRSAERTESFEEVRNDDMSPLFLATVEATEEAILNSLFMARTTSGYKGNTIQALPAEKVVEMIKRAQP